MPPAAAMKLTLKHGRGKVHELDCLWLYGPKREDRLGRYHVAPASEVRGRRHCSQGPIGSGKAESPGGMLIRVATLMIAAVVVIYLIAAWRL